MRATRGLRGFDPAAQNFRDAPSLGNATAGEVRLLRVEHFADRPEASLAELFWKRVGGTFDATLTEYVGASACWGPLAPKVEVPEVLLRFGVRDRDKARVEAFSKMVPAVILSGPPGVAVTGGRPQAQEVVAYWPALVPRDLVRPALVTVSQGPATSA